MALHARPVVLFRQRLRCQAACLVCRMSCPVRHSTSLRTPPSAPAAAACGGMAGSTCLPPAACGSAPWWSAGRCLQGGAAVMEGKRHDPSSISAQTKPSHMALSPLDPLRLLRAFTCRHAQASRRPLPPDSQSRKVLQRCSSITPQRPSAASRSCRAGAGAQAGRVWGRQGRSAMLL